MARMKKAQFLRNVTHEGLSAPLYFNPNSEKFFTQLGDEVFEDPEAKVVQQWIYEHIKETFVPVWVPVIEFIGDHKPYPSVRKQANGMSGSVSFVAERFWAAKWSDTSIVRAEWNYVWTPNLQKFPLETERPGDDLLRTRYKKEFLAANGDPEFKFPRHYKKTRYSSDIGYSHAVEVVLVPYTEEAWAGIDKILRSLTDIGVRLNDLLVRKNTSSVLEAASRGSVNLLMSGEVNDGAS